MRGMLILRLLPWGSVDMAEPIADFLGAIQRYEEDFKSIEVRMVAFKWQDAWVNLSTRAVLSVHASEPFKPAEAIPTLRDLRVELGRFGFSYLDELLRVFKQGSLAWKGHDIIFRRVEGERFGKEYTPSFRSLSRHWSQRQLGIDTRAFLLSGSEAGVQAALGHEGLETLKSRIASLPQPFDGLGDFVRTFTGYPDIDRTSYYSSLEIIAPIWLRLRPDSSMKSRKLQVRAQLRRGFSPDQASLGVIVKEGDIVLQRIRKTLMATPKKRTSEYSLEAGSPLPSESDNVSVLLSYRGDLVDQMDLFRNRIGSRNPKMGVVSAIDAELESFLAGLGGTQKKPGGGLEQAFLTLLTFLGFSCLHIGRDERNPDILAWAQDPGVAFVIECTTAEPDIRNKATKFASRLRYIASVSRTGEVVGLLVTTLSREVINPADRERLKVDNVILVDQQGIDRLRKLAEGGGSLGEALEVLEALAAEHQLTYRRLSPRTE